MENYKVTIKDSSRELTVRERVMCKDTTNATRLDTATEGGAITITPVAWVELAVHNDKAKDDKDYNQYIIFDKDGTKYLTGSANFFSTFLDIFNEMTEGGELFEIQCYKMPSKNYANKTFITCSLV